MTRRYKRPLPNVDVTPRRYVDAILADVFDKIAPLPPLRIIIDRVRLDRGGYDNYGKYWGTGAPLFEYYVDEEVMQDDLIPDDLFRVQHIRAQDRADAKRKIIEKYPNARFTR